MLVDYLWGGFIMDNVNVLYDVKAFVYFVRQADRVFNIDYIDGLDSYQKRKRLRLLSLFPSLFFSLFFIISLLYFFVFNRLISNAYVLGLFLLMSFLSLFVLYTDIKAYYDSFYPRDKQSFLSGRVVGFSADDNDKLLHLIVDEESEGVVLVVAVAKSVYENSKVDDQFWIYSEDYTLFAIKDS